MVHYTLCSRSAGTTFCSLSWSFRLKYILPVEFFLTFHWTLSSSFAEGLIPKYFQHDVHSKMMFKNFFKRVCWWTFIILLTIFCGQSQQFVECFSHVLSGIYIQPSPKLFFWGHYLQKSLKLLFRYHNDCHSPVEP